jgi:hypothetical protein
VDDGNDSIDGEGGSVAGMEEWNDDIMVGGNGGDVLAKCMTGLLVNDC